MHRVVVTGLGPVSNIGIGALRFREALHAGRSGTSPIRSFDTKGFPHVYAGEVHDFQPETILEHVDTRDWGRTSLFAAAAARLAVRDGGLDMGRVEPARVGVVMGTTCGESRVVESLAETVVNRGFAAQSARELSMVSAARIAYAASEELGAEGESLTISTACSASNYAVGHAFDALRSGSADVMIAGGADSVCRWAHAGFYRLGALAEKACAPFDRDRTGMLTAEGGAAVLLETLEHARARKADVYAEVLGYRLNCDAEHMVAPDAASIAECIRRAHASAGITAADVDYICAHGTGTRANDLCEASAIAEVFQSRLPPVSSIKSMLGHTMGAASGFGAMACCLATRFGVLPPTINWRARDPELPEFDAVPNVAREARVRVAQNHGFAFGGNNAILLLGAL